MIIYRPVEDSDSTSRSELREMGAMIDQRMESNDFPIPSGFFAYASTPPDIPATISAAIQSINQTQTAKIKSWESLQINGKYIIAEICAAIDASDFFCADVTGINPNVMFELGFAIARNKRIWLIPPCQHL